MQVMIYLLHCSSSGGDSVDIGDLVANALNGIVDVYDVGVNFGAKEPEIYAIYNYTEAGAEYAEGRHNSLNYFVTLNVFSDKLKSNIYSKIRKTLENTGFSYIGGGKVDTTYTYPNIVQYHLDFGYVADDSGGDDNV